MTVDEIVKDAIKQCRLMTLDEAIKCAEDVAEESQRIVDTGIVFDNITIDELYADDTVIIEEKLKNCQLCAEEHKQLAEWLKELKQLREQTRNESMLDKITDEIEKLNYVDYGSMYSFESHQGAREMKADVLQIIDKYKAESEDIKNA